MPRSAEDIKAYKKIYRKKNALSLKYKKAAEYKRNIKRYKIKHAEYRADAEHKKKAREYNRKYREIKREYLAEKRRLKRLNMSPEERAEETRKKKLYHAAHPEMRYKSNARYRARNLDLYQAALTRRRARKASSAINDLTTKQWQSIKAAYGFRCVYCHRKMQRLSQDHIIPLSKGGNNTASNIVPACQSCNSKKHTGPILSPIQQLLLLAT